LNVRNRKPNSSWRGQASIDSALKTLKLLHEKIKI